MPRKKTPTALKLLKGTYQPCRAAKEAPTGLQPLPGPPDRLPPEVREVWAEVSATAPHLREPDQLMFEVFCCLTSQFRQDPANMQSARISILQKCMADLYLTPGTRPNIPPEPEPGEYDNF
ncbi:MAG: hypothetical protein U9P00_11005 [Pseudomonadota bacterium]|nr:hypothetical protein [Pseudomonadota bacterium]